MKNLELDWFELETRMRSMVSQIVQPLFKSNAENASSLETLLKKSSQNSKQLAEIENIIGTGESKTGWIKEIESSFNEISLEVKLLKASVSQSFAEINQKVLDSEAQLQSVQASFVSYDKQLKIIEKQLQDSQRSVQTTNNTVFDYFEKTKGDLSQKLNDFTALANNCAKLSDQAIKKTADLGQKIIEIFQNIEKIRALIREQNMQMVQFSHEKASTDEFFKFTGAIEQKFENSADKARLLDNKVQEIVRYIDLYMPFDIQVHISDNLYSFLNRKSLKIWTKFEDKRRKELQKKVTDFESISDISEIVNRTLNSIKIFDNRKDDIYYKMMRRKVDEENKTSDEEKKALKQKKKLSQMTLRNNPVPSISLQLDKEILEEVALVKKDFLQMKSSIQSLEKNQSQIKSTETNLNEELRIHLQVLEESIKLSRKEDHERLANDLIVVTEKLEEYRHKLKNCYDAIINISELVSSLVEFGIVTNAVLDQEEKDKKDMAKQPSELHLPPVPIRKQSMPSTDYLSGKALLTRPQIVFNSTPLKYKNVLYTREELIELIGKVITKAWTEASSKPPFTVKTLRIKSNSNNLNTTLNVSSSLLKPN